MFCQGIQSKGFFFLIPQKKIGTIIFLQQSAFPYMRKLYVFTRNASAGISLLETEKKSFLLIPKNVVSCTNEYL